MADTAWPAGGGGGAVRLILPVTPFAEPRHSLPNDRSRSFSAFWEDSLGYSQSFPAVISGTGSGTHISLARLRHITLT
jgi:hypothetical protein